MATATEPTAFRTIDMDGQLVDEDMFAAFDRRLIDFTDYTATQDQEGTTAQWYAIKSGDILAEASEGMGLVVYPAADLFA